MIRTSRQLKDLIRNLSKEYNIEPHVLMRKYMMERFLERVSMSDYRNSFILKGGLLVSAFVGIETRATMDIDTTVKGVPVSIRDIKSIIENICSVPIDDNIEFHIKSVTETLEEAEYTGIRISLDTIFDGAITPLKIDISTGDAITPKEILYHYKLMFEDRTIPIMAYPIETVLAEKIETIISRSVTNTRMRDFYDIHILKNSYYGQIDWGVLPEALKATASKRNSTELMNNAEKVLTALENSEYIQNLWNLYQNKFSYSKDHSWEDIMLSVRKICVNAELPVKKPSLIKQLHSDRSAETKKAIHTKSKDTFEL